MSDMDDSKSGGSTDIQGLGRPDKPLGRGLEDVSHLFLSHRTDEAAANDRAVVRSNEPASPPPPSRAGVTLLRPASVTKDWLTIVLTEFDDAVEEGLRTIDASIPCHPCGEIDHRHARRAAGDRGPWVSLPLRATIPEGNTVGQHADVDVGPSHRTDGAPGLIAG